MFTNNKKGQAMIEMAIFGTLILFVFGMLISYAQRMNEQQYIQMEAFRRALEKACTFAGAEDSGAGASVQYTAMENKRLADLSDSFRKGSPTAIRGSSSVFWAVPQTGSQPENKIVYKINDDEATFDTGTQIESISTSSGEGSKDEFTEKMQKTEGPGGITTSRESHLTDTITTTLMGEDGSTIWQVTQGAYRDADGQIRYGSQAVDNTIDSARTWRTDF